ncbi:hypothetical protein EH228_04575 [Erwinia endophytica]|nr:hypothetical protein EH228_04575 [Erwinia endophytica]
MIIAKIIGVGWMLVWFWTLLRSCINLTLEGKDPFAALFALALAWFVIGFVPVAIVKFGWRYIG